MNSLGARLTNNNYHLYIDKGMKGPNKAIYLILYLSNLIALFANASGLRLNQIDEKIDLVYLLLKERPFNSSDFL